MLDGISNDMHALYSSLQDGLDVVLQHHYVTLFVSGIPFQTLWSLSGQRFTSRLQATMILQHTSYLANKNVVLASASPRRLELLQLVGIRPRVVTSTFEETLPKSDYKSGAEYAVATSRGKALEVAERLTRNHEHVDLIIGADTVSLSAQTRSVHTWSGMSLFQVEVTVAGCFGTGR